MVTRVKQYYPSDKFDQKTNTDSVDLGWAINYLTSLQNKLPKDLSGHTTAWVEGWSHVRVKDNYEVPPAEVHESQVQFVKKAIAAAVESGKTLSTAELQAFLDALKQLEQ